MTANHLEQRAESVDREGLAPSFYRARRARSFVEVEQSASVPAHRVARSARSTRGGAAKGERTKASLTTGTAAASGELGRRI
jgi:hypothetical protein